VAVDHVPCLLHHSTESFTHKIIRFGMDTKCSNGAAHPQLIDPQINESEFGKVIDRESPIRTDPASERTGR
jgi:hypothetical protein